MRVRASEGFFFVYAHLSSRDEEKMCCTAKETELRANFLL